MFPQKLLSDREVGVWIKPSANCEVLPALAGAALSTTVSGTAKALLMDLCVPEKSEAIVIRELIQSNIVEVSCVWGKKNPKTTVWGCILRSLRV